MIDLAALWPLGPYSTALAAALVLVSVWRRVGFILPAVILLDYFATAAVKPFGLVAVGVVDFATISILCTMPGWRPVSVAALFTLMIPAYVASATGAIDLPTMWTIVEVLAAGQVAIVGGPDGLVRARRFRFRILARNLGRAGTRRADSALGNEGVARVETLAGEK